MKQQYSEMVNPSHITPLLEVFTGQVNMQIIIMLPVIYYRTSVHNLPSIFNHGMFHISLYNYTQIALYQNLLRKKHGELIGNMERLEGGLEKLKSTAAQVRHP